MSEPQVLSAEQVDEIERSFLGTQFEQTIGNLCTTIRRADDVSAMLGESEAMHLHENLVMSDEVKRLQAENAYMRVALAAAEAGFLYLSMAVIDGDDDERLYKHAVSLADKMRAAHTPNVQS